MEVNDQKPVILMVHGSSGRCKVDEPGYIPTNVRHWHGWIKDKLIKEGFGVENPLMPRDWDPDYEEWKEVFEKFNVDENTILIGISCGGSFILKWLGETGRRVGRVFLIAPSKILGENEERLRSFVDFKVDPTVRQQAKEMVIFISDDGPHRIESAHLLSNKLGVRLIELENRGHFVISDNPINKEFPELLEMILRNN